MEYQKIEATGLKVTIQRMAILEFLENTKVHPSAEMVYKEIKTKYPRVTLSTIYNTLETFAENKIINKIFTLDGKARYDGNIDRHHHLYDKSSGKVFDIFDAELNKLINNYLKDKKYEDFEIENYQVDFIGKITKK